MISLCQALAVNLQRPGCKEFCHGSQHDLTQHTLSSFGQIRVLPLYNFQILGVDSCISTSKPILLNIFEHIVWL